MDAERLRALIDAGRSVVAERELEKVFDRLLGVARDLTGAKYAALGVLDESRDHLDDFITVGIDHSAHSAIGDLPRGRGVLGLLISDPQPVRLSDVGEHPWSYGFPHGHPPMKSFLGVPVVIRGEAWGNLYLTEKAGDVPFDDADEEAAVVLAAWAAIAIENARLHRSSEQRRHEIQRSLETVQATTDIARAVEGETDLDRVLELIAKRSRALVQARSLAILLSNEGGGFTVVATAGELPPSTKGARVSAGGSVAGRVLSNGRTERVEDLSSSIRFALGGLGFTAAAGLFVPLQFRGAKLGVIEAFDRVDGPQFQPDDERLLQAAAASAATAVATAQSVQRDRVRRSLQVAEGERKRWARELHDETLQAMGALRVLLSSGRRSTEPTALQGAVDQAVAQLTEDIENLRRLITELRPAALDDLGLAPALEALVERVRDADGLNVEAKLELADAANGGALSSEMETTIYRVVQEALTNVARHAQADTAAVDVVQDDARILVSVRDNGHGFDPSSESAGFGLTGMNERVELAGGSLSVSSSPAGTEVDVSLPVEYRVRQTA